MHNHKDYTIAILNPQFTRIKSLVASKTERAIAEDYRERDPRGLEYDFKAVVKNVYTMIYVDSLTYELRDRLALKGLRIGLYRLQLLWGRIYGTSLKLVLKNTDFTTCRDLVEDHKWRLYLVCKAIVDNNVKISNI